MKIKLSNHAREEHQNEQWNPVTILDAYQKKLLSNVRLIEGESSDVIYGWTRDNTCVGMIVSKVAGVWNKYRVVITGFAASEDYWKSV